MHYFRRQYDKILNSKTLALLVAFLRKLILPGFDGMSFYDVMRFFILGYRKGAITLRAAAISFNFFIALFPAILFFFTLIPYIPFAGFQESLLSLLRDIIPRQTYDMVEDILFDIIMRPRGGLLSVGFMMALYFATNGVSSMIEAFNQTYHTIETRSFIRQQLVSITLVVFLSVLIVLSILLITLGPLAINWFVEYGLFRDRYIVHIIILLKWIVIAGMFFLAFSLLYYFAPAKRNEFRFFSAGSTLATLLIILTSIGFNYYVSNFSRYNTLYGSIGTLLIFLLWMYLNSIILLIGFELNASIHRVKRTSERVRSKLF